MLSVHRVDDTSYCHESFLLILLLFILLYKSVLVTLSIRVDSWGYSSAGENLTRFQSRLAFDSLLHLINECILLSGDALRLPWFQGWAAFSLDDYAVGATLLVRIPQFVTRVKPIDSIVFDILLVVNGEISDTLCITCDDALLLRQAIGTLILPLWRSYLLRFDLWEYTVLEPAGELHSSSFRILATLDGVFTCERASV